MYFVLLCILGLAAGVLAMPAMPVPIGPLTLDNIEFEYKVFTGVGCNGDPYILGESGPVYDINKPLVGYEYPILCDNGYVLFAEKTDGWYLISGGKICINKTTPEEKLNHMLEKFTDCGPSVPPEPSISARPDSFMDLIDLD